MSSTSFSCRSGGLLNSPISERTASELVWLCGDQSDGTLDMVAVVYPGLPSLLTLRRREAKFPRYRCGWDRQTDNHTIIESKENAMSYRRCRTTLIWILETFTVLTYPLLVAAQTPGLVAAYGFNESSGTSVVDASGNNNGTLGSGVTRTTTGKFGSALVFNGSSFVTIPSTASLSLTSAMTLEAWVNPSTVSSTWRDVIYKGNDNYYLSATSTSTGKPAGGGTFGATTVQTYGTVALPVNTWTHLAVTYDGATLRLYVNGVQVSSLARTGNLVTSTNPLQIGGDSLYGQFFQGMIDEVRVYNVALTAAQIQTDMSTAVGGDTANTPPTISAIAAQTINEDTATGAIGFTVGDAKTVLGSLTVSGSSNNTALVPNANIVFGGSGANRTVTITPAANQNGTATITVTVSAHPTISRYK